MIEIIFNVPQVSTISTTFTTGTRHVNGIVRRNGLIAIEYYRFYMCAYASSVKLSPTRTSLECSCVVCHRIECEEQVEVGILRCLRGLLKKNASEVTQRPFHAHSSGKQIRALVLEFSHTEIRRSTSRPLISPPVPIHFAPLTTDAVLLNGHQHPALPRRRSRISSTTIISSRAYLLRSRLELDVHEPEHPYGIRALSVTAKAPQSSDILTW